MIVYTMVGTKDLDQAVRFYDPLFTQMGMIQVWRDDNSASWGNEANKRAPRYSVGYPFDGADASVGNGVMTAFQVPEAAQVDRLYEMAIQAGARGEGEPGLRPQYGDGFYAAYLRDLDGNKLAFVCYMA